MALYYLDWHERIDVHSTDDVGRSSCHGAYRRPLRWVSVRSSLERAYLLTGLSVYQRLIAHNKNDQQRSPSTVGKHTHSLARLARSERSAGDSPCPYINTIQMAISTTWQPPFITAHSRGNAGTIILINGYSGMGKLSVAKQLS